MNFTGVDASGNAKTFFSRTYGEVEYPGAVLLWGASGQPIVVADSDGSRLPVKVGALTAPLVEGGAHIGQVAIDDALPTGGNLIGRTSIEDYPAADWETDGFTMRRDLTSAQQGLGDGSGVEYGRAKIECSSTGANTVIPGVEGKQILLLEWELIAHGAVIARWEMEDGTDLTGRYKLADTGGIRGGSEVGMVDPVDEGDDLVLNLSTSVEVGGCLNYALLTPAS